MTNDRRTHLLVYSGIGRHLSMTLGVAQLRGLPELQTVFTVVTNHVPLAERVTNGVRWSAAYPSSYWGTP